MTSMISVTSSPAKDRKKSAHWTDNDTESLVNVLLRYKDSGRTPDNGFRPEVWKEASLVLERASFIGGPKTPEACKSRWQRIQRDFRAAKDMEEMPGFRWDRQEGRLIASQEAWKAAEARMEPYKYSRIHLTCYDTLAVLCPGEPIRSRARTKGRSSHASTSDTSSMVSLSLTASTSHLEDLNQQTQVVYQPHGHNGGMPMGEIQNGMGGSMIWETTGDEDGEGEYEPFGMNGGTQHPFMSQNHKRLPFDPSVMNTTPGHMLPNQHLNNNGSSPPKKPRLASSRPPSQVLHGNHAQLYAMTMPRSPTYNPQPQQTLLDPAVLTPSHPHPHSQPQQQQQQQHSHQHHQLPGHQIPSSHPHQSHLSHQHPAPDHQPPHLMVNTNTQSQTPQSTATSSASHHIATPSSNTISNMTPQTQQLQHRPTNTNTNSMSTPLHQHDMHGHVHAQAHIQTQPQTHQNSHPHQNQNQNQHHTHQTLHMPTPGHTLPSNPQTPISATPDNTSFNTPSQPQLQSQSQSTNLAAEVQYAGLSDAQRRTQAILQLQQESEMRDEEMVEVMAEFENNIAAADTYLAIKKDQLRRMYLRTIVQRRRQTG